MENSTPPVEKTTETSEDLVNQILAAENTAENAENILQKNENIVLQDAPVVENAENILQKSENIAKTATKKKVVAPKPAKTLQIPAKNVKTFENIEIATKKRFAITLNLSESEFNHISSIIDQCKQLKTIENTGEFVKQCIDFSINHDFVHTTLLPNKPFASFTITEDCKNIENKLFKGSIFKGAVELQEL